MSEPTNVWTSEGTPQPTNTWTDEDGKTSGGGGGGGTFTPALKFNDDRNSQYVPLVS